MISTINYNPKFLKLRKWIQIDKVYWYELSKNPNAMHILEKNLNKVNWYMLSRNPNAIHILEKNLDKVDWRWLSSNHNAIHILEKNLDKVNWDGLSENHNAIHILEKNLDKVNWYRLSKNPVAIHILEKNLDKVDWGGLSTNHNIFEYDYKEIKNTLYNDIGFVEELMMNRFHPSNMDKLYGWGFDDIKNETIETINDKYIQVQ